MISIKPKTRALITIKSVEDIIPHLKRVSKNWRSLTPLVRDRLIVLLSGNRNYGGMSLFHLDLRKEVLEMRSGTFSSEQYSAIFGWSEQEINELMDSKGKIFKETCKYTPGQKEFWMVHHGLSEEEAILRVSEAQRKLSRRKKKTTVNLANSLAYYIHRGCSEEEAIKMQSEVQKKRRNNCVEYWTSRGHSVEDAKEKISKIQQLRSKLSIEYWLHRGYSEEEAQEQAMAAQKKQLPGKISKVSRKFFEELLNRLITEGLNPEEFKFADDEQAIYITKSRRVYPDFIHLPSKKIIEFDGKYWHSKEGAKEKDEQRDNLLANLGYSILRIPETYNKMLWNKYISEAITFIKG